ncbi:MAG TPA: peptidase S1, partial [Ktedonobacteraceae bacterium]|nr:peptidase S1 [Ktedonobacteraceae bacterium]
MLQPDIHNDPTASYHPMETPPKTPMPPTRGPRTGRAVVLTMLLALLFGIVVFAAGFEFGRGNTASVTPNSSVATLQPGTNPQPTIPPLTGNNIEAIREAVIAKIRPTVVQVNVTMARGSALGSGVIIDKRGYIVTNNH